MSAFVAGGGDLSAVLPARLLETRSDADGTVDGDNVGAIRPGARGFMTLYACDADQPDASNINVGAGAVVSNAVFVALDDDGRVCIASSVRSDAIVDVVGYVTTPAAATNATHRSSSGGR